MTLNHLHAFFVYVFIGYFFIFPLIFFTLKWFRVANPRQRMEFYLIGLLTPFAGFAIYFTILVRRCELGSSPSNVFLHLFDAFCWLGIRSLQFIIPVMTGMMLLGVLKAAAGIFFLRRLRDTAVMPDIEVHRRVMGIVTQRSIELGIAVPEIIYTKRRRVAAMVLGVFRPSIILHHDLAEQLSGLELDHLLCHELVHVRSGDTAIGLVLHLVRDVMIFSPFSTLLFNGYMIERERLCDEQTTSLIGDVRGYAATLLKVWRLQLDWQERRGFSAGFLSGRRGMEYRITGLLENRQGDQMSFLRLSCMKALLLILNILFLGLIC